MKKLVLFLMCLTLVFASPAVLAGNLEAVGGVTFNTFDLTLGTEGDDFTTELNDIGNGTGMYVGGRYWFSDKLAAGLGYDLLKSQPSYRIEESPDYYEMGLKLDISGLYGELVYQLTDYIKLRGALANYNMTAEYYEEEDTSAAPPEDKIEGSGLGYIIGGEMSYPLKGNLSLNSSLGYRIVPLTLDEPLIMATGDQTVDVKGFFFSAGLNMPF